MLSDYTSVSAGEYSSWERMGMMSGDMRHVIAIVGLDTASCNISSMFTFRLIYGKMHCLMVGQLLI